MKEYKKKFKKSNDLIEIRGEKMEFEAIANVLALLFSLVGIVLLVVVLVKFKIAGTIGKFFKWMIVGIFLAVVVHAAFELAAIYNVINEQALFPVMGTLLSIGSLCFIIGSWIALRDFKEA